MLTNKLVSSHVMRMKGGMDTIFQKMLQFDISPLTKLAGIVTIFLPSVWRQTYLLSTFYNFLSKIWKCTYVLLSSANQFFHVFHVQMGKPLIGYLKTIKILHYFINYLLCLEAREKHLWKHIWRNICSRLPCSLLEN